MASAHATLHASESYRIFSNRAPGYDAGNGGWHRELALDFVKWIKPQPGEIALDLACGTGLVTLPLATAIGPEGKVVAIDLTPGMLAEARKKSITTDSAPITWIESDITSLFPTSAVQSILASHSGFDIITLCSALVLLHDQSAALKHWATLLKPGGRIIIDVPTEQKTLQNLFTGDLRQSDVYSLEKLYKDAGLEVEKSWRTRSYFPERWYEADEAMSVFNEQTNKTYKAFAEKGKLEEARNFWPDMWRENLIDGKFWDGHALYITIGRKPVI